MKRLCRKIIGLSVACLGYTIINLAPVCAQVCTGYELYKQDFGGDASSPDIGIPLPDSVTSYIYTTGQINDGDYGIRKTIPHTFSHWLSGTDHTENGYMMVINASYDPGLFYQTRINGLCQGSSFYFSAWIANLLRAGSSDPLDPDIRFVIRSVVDSSIIADTTTGILSRYSTLTWVQYGIHFKLPAGESSVLLQMFNNQTGGAGNDLAMDDITFSLCGPPINIGMAGTYQQSEDACVGDQVSFNAVIPAGYYKNPQYQWQFGKDTLNWQDIPGATTTSLRISDAKEADSGWYRLLVAEQGNITSPHCRIASKAIPLHVWTPQAFSIEGKDSVCQGTGFYLTAPPAAGYLWAGPNGFTSTLDSLVFNPASINQGGIYQLRLTTNGGCTSEAQKTVVIQADDLLVSIHQDSVFCEGNAVTLNAFNNDAAYLWNSGQQIPAINADTSGFYKVTVSKGACTKSDSVTLREILRPVVNLGNDTTICIGEPYVLNVAIPQADSYLWQDGSADTVYQVSESGTYSVVVRNQCGTATGTVHVNTEECANRLLFPTAFSPNGDGMNDVFKPKVLLRILQYQLRIFDRWGNQVYQSTNPSTGWDGTYNGHLLPVGAYVWSVHYVRVRDEKSISQQGTITLIR